MDLKEEGILGSKIYEHWYYVSKGRAMRKFLGSMAFDEVLDVGAGSGIFSRQLLDHDVCQSAVCVDPHYALELKENQNGKPIKFLSSLEETTQNLVLMMDVLEHVEDDVALLRQYTRTMPSGGRVLVTVPAFQFLWSGHDVFLEHYRRYTVKMLENTILEAGLVPVKSRYFFASLFPAVAAVRLMKKVLLRWDKTESQSELKVYPDWLNNLLIAIHDVERVTLFPLNRALGLSVFCLCEKP